MPKNYGADSQIQNPKHATIVCITDQYGCDIHINAGRALADLTDTELVVVHIASPADAESADTIEYLYGVARQNNAVMQVLYGDNPGKALIKFIKHSKVRNVITGLPEGSDAVPVQLWNKFTHIAFYTVDISGNLSAIQAPKRKAKALTGSARMSSL